MTKKRKYRKGTPKQRAKAKHKMLKAKGRASWSEFQRNEPKLAWERLQMLQHFKSI